MADLVEGLPDPAQVSTVRIIFSFSMQATDDVLPIVITVEQAEGYGAVPP